MRYRFLAWVKCNICNFSAMLSYCFCRHICCGCSITKECSRIFLRKFRHIAYYPAEIFSKLFSRHKSILGIRCKEARFQKSLALLLKTVFVLYFLTPLLNITAVLWELTRVKGKCLVVSSQLIVPVFINDNSRLCGLVLFLNWFCNPKQVSKKEKMYVFWPCKSNIRINNRIR